MGAGHNDVIGGQLYCSMRLCVCVVSHRDTAMVSGNTCFYVALLLIDTGSIVTPVFGAKILFVPANIDSHVLTFSRLAADLTQLGHVTRVLAPSNARVPHFVAEATEGGGGGEGNFSYTTYWVEGDVGFLGSEYASATLLRSALSNSVWEKFTLNFGLLREFFGRCEADCVRLVENDRVMRQVRAGGFQFAVMDPVVAQCYYAIPYSLGVPYASYSAPGLAWFYRVPRLPSFVSSLGLG